MAPIWPRSPRERKPAQGDGDERNPTSAALLLAVIVSLYVLFLPTYGPLLDHHFVEKAPNHAHVYLGHGGPEHTHYFETRLGHRHDAGPRPATSTGSSEIYDGTDGIVYLAAYEGAGQSVATALLTVAPASIVFPQPTGGPFRSGLTGDENRLLAAFVGPPRRPPRS